MNKGLLRITLFFLMFAFCLPTLLKADTTGKIAGKVTDAETGESLPGINIIIENTTMGAATNIDGSYVINNITPGSYNVIASGVGFVTKKFVDVKVSADFTTLLDFQLSTGVITVETVVVKAEAPMIRKDLTSSRTAVDAGQIKSLPVESINQILSLQAGIIQGAGGELHIRGGRSNEITYTVNGVSITNPFNSSSRTVTVATNAIQELSVVSGTFNAEYGGALSGIVNTITKEGGQKYHGYISAYTGDHVSSRNDVFLNIDNIEPVHNYTGEMTFSGPMPFLKNHVNFFLSGRYDNRGGYLYGVRLHNTTDSVYKNPLDPNDIRVAQTGDGSTVAMNPSKSFSTTGKLTIRPASTIKLNYDFLYSNSEYQNYLHNFKYNPDANYNNFEWGMLNSLELRHALSNSTYYTVLASYNLNDFKQYLYPLLDNAGNEVSFHPGMDLSGLHADPRYQPEHKLNRATNQTFYAGGTLNNHFYQRSATFSGKIDLTSQLNENHEVKFGLNYSNHKLEFENFAVKRDTVRFLTPTIPSTSTADHDSYTKRPVEFSGYLQDKMEFESIILNVGLRYDYFDANSKYSTDIFNPSPNNPNLPPGIDKESLLADAQPKQKLSPRVGISFPITDNGIIHFSYGHFYQMPPFQNLYTNPDFKYSFSIGTPVIGNADLNPEKTITYELGLQQQLTETIAFNITGFYKDVRDLLATQEIRISGDETYIKYVNKDYANIKGLTFSLFKRRTQNEIFGFTLDYTFQVAQGNETGANSFFLDLSSGRQSEKIPVYLTWDQSHTLNATFNVGEPRDWNVTLVGKFGTGLPYTPQIFDQQIILTPNSDRKPSQATVDLLAEKSFFVFGFDMTLFLKIYNLFDALNERFVFEDTGRATYTLLSTRGAAKANDELAQKVDGVQPTSDYYNRPQYYLPPREVRLGINFEF